MALTTIDTYGIKDGAVQIDDIGTLAGNLTINDSGKLRLGTGLDLQLYHDGSNSYINSLLANGDLIIDSAQNFYLKHSGEKWIQATNDSGVQIYFDNVKKFETTSAGINIFGTTTCNSTINLHGELNLSGTPQNKYFDASITDGSTDYWMNFRAVRGDDASEHTVQMRYQNDGGVELNHNGTKKFETTADGIEVTGKIFSSSHIDLADNVKLLIGNSDDLEVYHNGSHSYIDNLTGNLYFRGSNGQMLFRPNNSEDALVLKPNGAVQLYYDNTLKLETVSYGVVAKGSVEIQSGSMTTADSSDSGTTNSAIFGTGSDLKIYHNGSHSFIDNDTGDLYIGSGFIGLLNAAMNEYKIKAFDNGAVELFHDGVKKFETISTGVKVTGNLHLNGGSSGTDSYIYTNNAAGIIYQADDNGHIFQTYASSAWNTRLTITDGGNVRVPDNGKFTAGASDDFQILHDGTNNEILSANGAVHFYSGANIEFRKGWSGSYETVLKAIPDGAVELYHDNGKRFETTSYGNASTGQVRVLNSGLANDVTTPAFSCGDAGTGIYRTGSNSIGYSANGTQKWAINSSGYLTLFDNVKLQIGSGEDLKIYHDGTHSYVTNNTGDLFVGAPSGKAVYLRPNNGANGVICHPSAGIELFFNNSSQCQTFDGGLNFQDNKKAEFGGSGDLKIYHDGNNNLILGSPTVLIKNKDNNESYIRCNENAAVELHYDNSKKFETISEGAKVHGHLRFDDSKYIKLGTGADVQMFHNGANFHIQHLTSGSTYMDSVGNHHFRNANGTEYRAKFTNNGECELYYDAAIKFQTRTGGAYVYGKGGGTTFAAAQAMHASDRCGLEVQGELTGIKIASTYNDANHPEYGLVFVQGPSTSSYNCWSISPDGPARGNNLRFHYQAQSSNIHVGTNCKVYMTGTGDWVPYTNNASDLGTSSHRWRNVYTNDLNLSNEGNTNDVDGTWGNYTIQEGEEDLFLLNRRNGKKYKFNLTEVS